MSLVEVERKRALEKRELLERRLEELGFVSTGPVVEVDTYYSRPDVDFLETVECLRVRERESGCEVTYKPASDTTTHSAGGVVAKRETNVALADGSQAEHAHQLLKVLGMVLLARVEKSRTCHRASKWPELSVVVDTVAGLGSFVETEIVSAEPREDVVQRLEEIEQFLGLDFQEVVTLPYRDLVLSGQGGAEAPSRLGAGRRKAPSVSTQ